MNMNRTLIAAIATVALLVASVPQARADGDGRVIAGAIIAGVGMAIAASGRHRGYNHADYRTGGGYYIPPRYAVPPGYGQRPPYGYGYYRREPNVFRWRREQEYGQQCCHVWTTYGWRTIPGPCPTFRAYPGYERRQRPGYPY